MNEQEAMKVLMMIQAAYPNFKVSDRTTAIKLWSAVFPDIQGDDVMKAVTAYIMSDRSGFAPTPGQIRGMIIDMAPSNEINEGTAWEMVYKALSNGLYHANEEFNALPPDIRRAVGGAGQLSEWARIDEDSLPVAESNFKRAYRAVMDGKRKMSMLPESMRPMLEEAPLAAIEDKHEEETGQVASPEWVSQVIAEWRASVGA